VVLNRGVGRPVIGNKVGALCVLMPAPCKESIYSILAGKSSVDIK
jgi:hypothetical protein